MAASPEEGEVRSPLPLPPVPLQPQPPPPTAPAEEQPTTPQPQSESSGPANGHAEPAPVGLSIKGGAVHTPSSSVEPPTPTAEGDDKTQLPSSSSSSAPAPTAAAEVPKAAAAIKKPRSIFQLSLKGSASNPAAKAPPNANSRSRDKAKLQSRIPGPASSSFASTSSTAPFQPHSYAYDPAPAGRSLAPAAEISPAPPHRPLPARPSPAVVEDDSYKPLRTYSSPPKAPRARAPSSAAAQAEVDAATAAALKEMMQDQAPVNAPSGAAGGDAREAAQKLEDRRKEKEKRDREMEAELAECERQQAESAMRAESGGREVDRSAVPRMGFAAPGGSVPTDWSGGQAPAYQPRDYSPPHNGYYRQQSSNYNSGRGGGYGGGGGGRVDYDSQQRDGRRGYDDRRGGGGRVDRSRDGHDDREDRTRGPQDDRHPDSRHDRRDDRPAERRDSHRRPSQGQGERPRNIRPAEHHGRSRSRSRSPSSKRKRRGDSVERRERDGGRSRRDRPRSPRSPSRSKSRDRSRSRGKSEAKEGKTSSSRAAEAALLAVENQDEEEEEAGTPPPKQATIRLDDGPFSVPSPAPAVPSHTLPHDSRPPLSFGFKSVGLPAKPAAHPPRFGGAQQAPPPAPFAPQPPRSANLIDRPPPPPHGMDYPALPPSTFNPPPFPPPPSSIPHLQPPLPPGPAPPPPPPALPLDDHGPHRDDTPHAPQHPALESQAPTPKSGRSPRSTTGVEKEEQKWEEPPNPRRRVRVYEGSGEDARHLRDPWLSEKERDAIDASPKAGDEMEIDMELAVSPTPAPEEDFEERTFVGSSHITEYTLQEKLGEGTFGVVWKGVKGQITGVGEDEARKIEISEEKLVGQGLKVRRGDVVALKQIILHNEGDGMPITSLREIRILKSLDHPNIVPVVDIAYEPGNAETFAPGKTYMVFPYMDHDLAGLLENHQVRLLPSHIKQYAMQLLEGTRYLHLNGILHRDMKAANLLISNAGVLMIADFGLARSIEAAEKRVQYTNCVVTRWYRPPELLIGETKYHYPVDMWGVGCVIAEMFRKKPIFPGESDLDQAHKIFKLCGSPNSDDWPGWRPIAGLGPMEEHIYGRHPRTIRADALGWSEQDQGFADLMDKILVLDPSKRLTASQALDHEWFWTDPMPTEPSQMPSYNASHELDKRKREEERPRMPQIPQIPPPLPRPPVMPPFQQQQGYNNQPLAYGPPPGFGPPPSHAPYGGNPPPMGYQQHQGAYGQQNRGAYGAGGRGGGGGGYRGGRGGARQPDHHYESQGPSWQRGQQNVPGGSGGGGGGAQKMSMTAMLAMKPGAGSRDQPPKDAGPTNLQY